MVASVPRWVAGTQEGALRQGHEPLSFTSRARESLLQASPIYPSQLHQGALGFDLSWE